MEKIEVAIQRGEDIKGVVNKTLHLIGGLENVIKNGDAVFISPNYGVPMKPDTGATTNPEVVVGVIKAAKEAGAEKVYVGESSVVGFNAGKVMVDLGVQEIFEEAGAEVLNLDEDQKNVIVKKIPQGKLLKQIKIFKPAVECDVLISVPVLKTHIYAGVSLGMKNLKGTLPDDQKKLFHRVGARKKTEEPFELDRCISDMMTAHHPDFTVIDGIVGQEGFVSGFGVCGNAVRMNTIIAGADYVAVDAVGAYVMGFDPMKVNHIRYCHEIGLGEADLKKITILGENLDSIRREFRPAIPGKLGSYENVTVIEGGSCSGCSFAIRWTLNAFKIEQINRWDKTVFFVGSDIQPPERVNGEPFLIGKCACKLPIKNGRKITGCPPPFFHIVDELRQTGRSI